MSADGLALHGNDVAVFKISMVFQPLPDRFLPAVPDDCFK